MKRILAIFALLGFGSVASAATKPSFAIADATVLDNAPNVSIEVDKSAKASSYSKITVKTVDGSAKAGVDYLATTKDVTVGNNTLVVKIPVSIVARPGWQGTRSFSVALTISRNGTAARRTATVTINDSEPQPAPPTVAWTKCADEGQTCYVVGTANVRYGGSNAFGGQSWTFKAATGSIGCDSQAFGVDPAIGFAKECDTDGTPSVAPTPTPTPTPPVPVPVPTIPAYDLGQSYCPSAVMICHVGDFPTPVPAGWTVAPIIKGGYARPLRLMFCAGAVLKIEALDPTEAYLNEPTLTSWDGHTYPVGGPMRLWAAHFVNAAGTQCGNTTSTVGFFEGDLEGIAPWP